MIPCKHFSLQKSRTLAFLAALSVSLMIIHSTSAAHVSSPKNHRMTQDDDLERRSDEVPARNSTAPTSQSDFVINSLEDEKKFGLKVVDKRHRYDQPQVELADNQLDQVPALPLDQQEEPQRSESQQIQARNEQEAVQLSEQQQQLAEQVIIDHRPLSGDSSSLAEQLASSTQSPPTSSTGSSLNTASSAHSTSTMSPVNQQTSGPSVSAMSGQTQAQWLPAASNQQAIYARQAPSTSSSNSNQQQQFGNMMSASNQVMSTVQYPTSINSIINDQQQPLSSNQQGQFQTQMINGQQQLVFVPQNGAASNLNSQIIGMAPNGRRMSISNWLRGLGSMLSNIFYRRDHGALNSGQLQPANMMMQASASAPTGSWIQLGPNAPHWLTQAQSAIQQLQQQHQQLGLPGSSRLSNFLSSNPQQQAANTVTITLPQQQLNGANTLQQQMGDLQTSGSSNSFVTIQAPAAITSMATNQPYRSQQSMSAQGQALLVGQLQQSTGSGAPVLQIQQQPNQIQVLTASQQQQPSASLVAKSNSDQLKQVASSTTTTGQSQSSIAPSSSGATHTRFSRSSKQQTKPQQQQQTTTPAIQTTNGNLPLAHYSHYSASD